MEQKVFKTDYQIEKEKREMAIYNERKELTASPGAMITAIDDHLMAKYGIHSRATIWSIMKRTEKRLKTQQS